MNILVTLLVLMLGQVAFAAGGEHGQVEVPRVVFYQAFNLTLVLIGIIYFTRTAIMQHFNSRRADYLAQAEKSKNLREDAEKKLREIEQRLAQLEGTKAQSIRKAEQDAEALRAQLLQDANTSAARVRTESIAASKAEVERAKTNLLHQMTQEALEGAQQILAKDISGADQGRLQENFVQQLN